MPAEFSALKEFLALTPFFGGLDDEGLQRVIGLLVERRFADGSTVFREGESGRSMFIVLQGELVAQRSGETGHLVKLMRYRGGDFFGETTLIEIQPRPFTVIAEQPTRLLELTSMDLYRLYREDIHAYVMVLQNINRELCRRLRGAGDRLTEVADQAGDEVTQIGMRSVPPRP